MGGWPIRRGEAEPRRETWLPSMAKKTLPNWKGFLTRRERGIRTPGTSQFNGFQDRRIRPLCHLSMQS
jgi:hypothetical protein